MIFQKKNYNNLVKICVTHFALQVISEKEIDTMGDENYLKELSKFFDYVFFGHSHEELDTVYTYKHNSCRLINVGSNYNDPKYRILEV